MSLLDQSLAGFLTGNGSNPICMPQLGRCSTAPLRPHLVQCADRRSTSLDVFGPHLMISGAKAHWRAVGSTGTPPSTTVCRGGAAREIDGRRDDPETTKLGRMRGGELRFILLRGNNAAILQKEG